MVVGRESGENCRRSSRLMQHGDAVVAQTQDKGPSTTPTPTLPAQPATRMHCCQPSAKLVHRPPAACCTTSAARGGRRVGSRDARQFDRGEHECRCHVKQRRGEVTIFRFRHDTLHYDIDAHFSTSLDATLLASCPDGRRRRLSLPVFASTTLRLPSFPVVRRIVAVRPISMCSLVRSAAYRLRESRTRSVSACRVFSVRTFSCVSHHHHHHTHTQVQY